MTPLIPSYNANPTKLTAGERHCFTLHFSPEKLSFFSDLGLKRVVIIVKVPNLAGESPDGNGDIFSTVFPILVRSEYMPPSGASNFKSKMTFLLVNSLWSSCLRSRVSTRHQDFTSCFMYVCDRTVTKDQTQSLIIGVYSAFIPSRSVSVVWRAHNDVVRYCVSSVGHATGKQSTLPRAIHGVSQR